jgi:hypothetical protein
LRRKHPQKSDYLSASTVEKKVAKNIDVEDVDKIDKNREGSSDSQNALLIRCWLKPNETTNYLEEHEGEQVEVTKKVYPQGRYIEVCGSQLLLDTENEYKDGLFPFARLVDHSVTREFFGIGETKFLKSPQMMLNKVLCWIMDSLDSTGKPQWIVDFQSGVDADNLTNEPALVVQKNQGTEVRKEPGAPIPAGMFNVFNLVKISFDQINGLGEPSQGQRPAGVTSGAAIESLQEAAQTRIRQKTRNLETYLKQVGNFVASRIMQFYTTTRMFRITNVKTGIPEFFEFYIGAGGVVKYQKLTPDEKGTYVPGGMVDVPISKELTRKGFPDIRVTVGSALPFARHLKAETAFRMFQLHIIDGEEVLKTVQWPNWEKVQMRMQEQAQRQAQVEAQGGGNVAAPQNG